MSKSLGEIKKDKLRTILKRYGVTKCYVSPGFDFECPNPDGRIYVDIKNSTLELGIYKLFTIDKSGLVDDDQILLIRYDDFSKITPNFV